MAKKKAMPATYKGHSTKLGGGGQFRMMQDAIVKTGKTPAQAAAIAATVGREKLGKKKFQALAAKGAKRAASKRKAKK